jgi:hypothetical protein
VTSKLKQSQIIGAKAGHNVNGVMKEEGRGYTIMKKRR